MFYRNIEFSLSNVGAGRFAAEPTVSGPLACSFRAEDRSANLLNSSPGAIAHDPVGTPANMLWHIRGKKRVWGYSEWHYRFVPMDIRTVGRNELRAVLAEQGI